MSFDNLQELLIFELLRLYSCELQITEQLPKVIKACSSPELKQAFKDHLNETKGQIDRLTQAFQLLDFRPYDEFNKTVENLFIECDEIIDSIEKSPLKDAALISVAQKIEHYEIASYGSAIAHAKQLENLDQVCDLLYESLEEEEAADKKLSRLAEGTFFTGGINKEAAEVFLVSSGSSRRGPRAKSKSHY